MQLDLNIREELVTDSTRGMRKQRGNEKHLKIEHRYVSPEQIPDARGEASGGAPYKHAKTVRRAALQERQSHADSVLQQACVSTSRAQQL